MSYPMSDKRPPIIIDMTPEGEFRDPSPPPAPRGFEGLLSRIGNTALLLALSGFGLLMAAFAVLATLLAAIGLYGVLAYTVSQRTREFGLRMALGAVPSRVRLMVLKQVAAMTVVGAIAGVAITLYVGTLVQSLLYQMQGRDPWVLGLSVAMLAAIAMLAGLVPAMRASKIDPMKALRYE